MLLEQDKQWTDSLDRGNVKVLYSTSCLQRADAKETETYIVSFAAELPEGLNIEPGALISSRVQRNPHGILLKQSRESLIHRQVLITLYVQELRQKNLAV